MDAKVFVMVFKCSRDFVPVSFSSCCDAFLTGVGVAYTVMSV